MPDISIQLGIIYLQRWMLPDKPTPLGVECL